MKNIHNKICFHIPEGEVVWNEELCGVEYIREETISVNKIYDKHYFDSGYVSKIERRLPHYRKLVDRICAYKVGDLLDIGSGAGLFLHEAEKRIEHCCGIEPSSAACEFAGIYCSSEIINQDPLDLPENYCRENWGIVSILDVLAHVEYPDVLLKQAYKCLKPNGILVLKTPNHPPEFYEYARKKYSNNITMYKEITHLPYQNFGWGIEGISKLVEKCGFKLLEVNPFDEFQHSGHFNFIDLFHPRRMFYKHQLRAAEKFLNFSSILLIAQKNYK